MKKHTGFFIFIAIFSIALIFAACATVPTPEGQHTVLLDPEGEKTSWNISVIKSPLTGMCYEVLGNTFGGGFNFLRIPAEHCDTDVDEDEDESR